MFQRIFKNPFSLISFFIISLAYLLVHYLSSKSQLSGINFFSYLLIFLSGIGFIRRTLLFWFPDLTIAVTLLALAFGTNLFYMVSLDYQLQPILLFSLYAMVVFFTAAWHRHQKQTYAVLLAISLGLIVLIQPTGVLSLLIPVLWGVHDKTSWKSKLQLIKNNLRQVNSLLGSLALTILIPVVLLNILPGEIPFLSFALPGIFYSFSSWFWNDIFSFDHGWLIYTPIMVLAFIGFYFLSDKNRPIFYSVFLFCILDLFLESSWSKLGTTQVFGQVAFIPANALFVLPLASLIRFLSTGKMFYRICLTAIIVILTILNIFQTWQFDVGILPRSGMTIDKYGNVFGRTHISEIEKQQMGGSESYASLLFTDESRFRKKNLAFYDFEDSNTSYKANLVHVPVKRGKMAITLNGGLRFSPALEIQYDEIKKKPWVGVRVTASVFVTNPESLSGVNLVISSIHEGNNYCYKKLNLGDLMLKPGEWNTVSLDYLIPSDPYPGDRLVSYVWYTGTEKVYIDDLRYDAFEYGK